MINIISSNSTVFNILEKSFIRSHGKILNKDDIYCFVSPSLKDEETLLSLISKKIKILIFGKISEGLAKLIGLEYNSNPIDLNELDFSHKNKEDRSNLFVKYTDHSLNKNNSLKNRYFYRFDFTDEWNNLGYGAITRDDSIWSVSQSLSIVDAKAISFVYDEEKEISIFSSIKDFENSSVLYINREVGTIDGLDWCVVEDFFNIYKYDELPSLPLICDVPYGYEAVSSSRLDCDQSVINSKPLVELYKKYNINISLAISTGINILEEDISFLNDFYDNGGGILSHTINHYYYWGENYNVAYIEGHDSKKWIEENIINLKELKYAVSPFHSNKPYSLQALNDCGYEGFISGIIHNDPEFLISTSGEVPFVNSNMVSHSQQAMLHGDCYYRAKNSIEIYKNSFENHYTSKKIFGYLDHPFGDYDYGWKNEKERLFVHEEFINYINSFDGVKWMTCTEILNFVVDKSNIKLTIDNNGKLIINRKTNNSKEKIRILYKNVEYTC